VDPEEEAQRRRAEELREQVERLKSGEEPEDEPETPREFVHRRMREGCEPEDEEDTGEPEDEEDAG
jgi:hypothetical protein